MENVKYFRALEAEKVLVTLPTNDAIALRISELHCPDRLKERLLVHLQADTRQEASLESLVAYMDMAIDDYVRREPDLKAARMGIAPLIPKLADLVLEHHFDTLRNFVEGQLKEIVLI